MDIQNQFLGVSVSHSPALTLAVGPGPSLWPESVFDSHGPNLYLAALALSLYLQALAD